MSDRYPIREKLQILREGLSDLSVFLDEAHSLLDKACSDVDFPEDLLDAFQNHLSCIGAVRGMSAWILQEYEAFGEPTPRGASILEIAEKFRDLMCILHREDGVFTVSHAEAAELADRMARSIDFKLQVLEEE